MSLKDWIPICIAALSLLVSALTFYLQKRDKKEILKITSGLGFTVSSMESSENKFFLEAANVGERVVTLSSFGFRMPNKQVLILPFGNQHVSLPHELHPGKSCTMYMPVTSAIEAIVQQGYRGTVKLMPQFSAQSGAKFRGKPLKFNLGAWSPET